MAVTKIWPVRRKAAQVLDYAMNPEKTTGTFTSAEQQALVDVIEYAANEDKTEQRLYASGVNCSISRAKEEFALTKERFGKEGGIVAFHAYQSFAEGEADPRTVHEIGVRLAKEMGGDKYQVVVATHLNTNCLHNHFILNPVSFKDGKRFFSSPEDYKALREISDRLCKEYGLSIVSKPRGRRVPYRLFKAEQAGLPTPYNVARQAIDEAISKSCNIHEFGAMLRSMGYQCQLNPNRKYWTITLPGWKKPLRTYRLGEEYSRESIEKRVNGNGIEARLLRAAERKSYPQQYSLKRRIDRIMGRTRLEKLYLRYCYELGYLSRYRQKPADVSRILKNELQMCELYSNCAKFLCRTGLSTIEDLDRYRDFLNEKTDLLTDKRAELRKAAKRSLPEDEVAKIKEEITGITGELSQIRKDLRLIKSIEERSERMAEKLIETDKDRAKGKEVRQI